MISIVYLIQLKVWFFVHIVTTIILTRRVPIILVINLSRQKILSTMIRHKHPQNLRTRCQSTTEAMRTTTRLNSRNPTQSKKHCPQDLACFHCCQCWVKFKDEYNKRVKYFQAKVAQGQEEIALLKSCIQKLSKENVDLAKRVKNTSDLQTIKANLRFQLEKQIDQQIKANDLIQKQKITALTQSLEQKDSIIAEIKDKISSLNDRVQELSQSLTLKQSQCIQLGQNLKAQTLMRQKEQQKNAEFTQEVQKLKSQQAALRKALTQKDVSISGMKSTLEHTDRLISLKSSQLADKDFQKTKIQLESSHKSQVLQKVQQVTQQQTRSLSMLHTEKSQLNNLLGSLRQQLLANDHHKHILKMALGEAETLAIQKSLSLQNMKHDVRMLKYTLPQSLRLSRGFLED